MMTKITRSELRKRIKNILKIMGSNADLGIDQIEQILYAQECGFVKENLTIVDIKNLLEKEQKYDTFDIRDEIWKLVSDGVAQFTPRWGVKIVLGKRK